MFQLFVVTRLKGKFLVIENHPSSWRCEKLRRNDFGCVFIDTV